MKVRRCNRGKEPPVAKVEACDRSEVYIFDPVFVGGAEEPVRQVVDGGAAVDGGGIKSDAAESGPVLQQPADSLRVNAWEVAARAAVRSLARLVAEAEVGVGAVVPAAPPAALHENYGVLRDAAIAALMEAQVVDAQLVVRVARFVHAGLHVHNDRRPEQSLFRNLVQSPLGATEVTRRVQMSARVFRYVHLVGLHPEIDINAFRILSFYSN